MIRNASGIFCPLLFPAIAMAGSALLFPQPRAPSECSDSPQRSRTAPIPPAISRPLPHPDIFFTPAAGLPAAGWKVNRIVIDAGHGGHDEGAIGPHGVREKDAVLDVALRTADMVRRFTGIEVVLTRKDDRFVPLRRRAAIANERRADLFLSIHANSSPRPGTSGPETYFPNLISLRDLREIALDDREIALDDKVRQSTLFARTIQASMLKLSPKSFATAPDRGTKRAPFVVLIGVFMPSALAEIGFLSNSEDEGNLASSEYRQRIAEALCEAIWQYSLSLNPPGGAQIATYRKPAVAVVN